MTPLAVREVWPHNKVLKGIPASPGIVIGPAYVLGERNKVRITHNYLDSRDEVEVEIHRFRDAVAHTRKEIADIKHSITDEFQEHAYILDTHLLILQDKLLYDETIRLIQEEHINAEWALKEAVKKAQALFNRIADPYIKSRIQDVGDVSERVLRRLTGGSPLNLRNLAEPVIIVAVDLSPVDTTQMSTDQVKGFITETGGKTSHTAIMAQSMEIPAVVALEKATLEIDNGDTLILDGLNGTVVINPDANMLDIYRQRKKKFEDFKHDVGKCSFLPAITLDEHQTQVLANIEFQEEVGLALDYGADGIGLYRTEFLYLRQQQLPTEEELFEDYKTVAGMMAPRRVTIRTLDIGGDKFASHLEYAPGINPAMGLRAIRFCLKEHSIFRTQLRAILRASLYGQVRLMFPLISGMQEVVAARRILEEIKGELHREGHGFDPAMPVGLMIEVPSAVMLADLLAREADFFSIGTNDLIQYALAIDRGNKYVASMYQPLHPAVLRMIKQVVDGGHAAGISVAVCGEMAGDPLYTPILLGLGVDELSMNALAIPVVKRIVRHASMEEAQEFARQALQHGSVEEVNAYVTGVMAKRFPEVFIFGRELASAAA
ncbi:MAG: phosphoenolpyruvate--protein phosphotransferase [Deltaproteobacteria bacterium]|nr:phosphoenolpyruvate--protein phosphotransferase [Deltaproteobacteria bacterium]